MTTYSFKCPNEECSQFNKEKGEYLISDTLEKTCSSFLKDGYHLEAGFPVCLECEMRMKYVGHLK